jgi:hypothetical protein
MANPHSCKIILAGHGYGTKNMEIIISNRSGRFAG